MLKPGSIKIERSLNKNTPGVLFSDFLDRLEAWTAPEKRPKPRGRKPPGGDRAPHLPPSLAHFSTDANAMLPLFTLSKYKWYMKQKPTLRRAADLCVIQICRDLLVLLFAIFVAICLCVFLIMSQGFAVLLFPNLCMYMWKMGRTPISPGHLLGIQSCTQKTKFYIVLTQC